MDSIAAYYIIAAIVIVLSWVVLKVSKHKPVPARVKVRGRTHEPRLKVSKSGKIRMSTAENDNIDSIIERLEDIIADLDSARDA